MPVTASPADFPEEPPTPRPWDSDEQSVRESLRKLGTHMVGELANIRGTLELELRGIHRALTDLEKRVADRAEDTGRHLSITDQAVGRAEGKAEAALRRQRDSDPVRSLLIVVVESVGKHVAKFWLSHTLTAAVAAGLAWLATHHR